MYEEINSYYTDSESIWNLEKALHKKYRDCKYKPKIKFGGYSECFNLDLPLNEILNNLDYA